MASPSRVVYTGVTNDIYRRARQHKSKEIDGFTARYNVTQLVYYEIHDYVLNAIAREKEIKGWRREKKVRLIESVNPDWRDLAEDPSVPWNTSPSPVISRSNVTRDPSVG